MKYSPTSGAAFGICCTTNETTMIQRPTFDTGAYEHPTHAPSIPTQPPSNAPITAPTSITFSPTTAPSISPTQPPSVAPTFAPSMAPTNTPTYQPTCKTIEYGWECFLGDISGVPAGRCDHFNANGEFNMSDGTWDFPYAINFDDNNIVISGEGHNTTWQYSDTISTWIKCRWPKCWLKLKDLTIASNRTSTDDKQFEMSNGGTLIVENVIFDGNNYQTAQGTPFWSFNDDRVTVIFIDCYFTNHDVMYQISNGVNARFINCIFDGNALTTVGVSFDKLDAMFTIDAANVLFDNCTFKDNTQNNRLLFSISNAANVSITNTTFTGNENIASGGEHQLIYLNSEDVELFISNSVFENNKEYTQIIYVNDNNINVIIQSTIFDNNMNIGYDYDVANNYIQSLRLYGTNEINIEDTTWYVNLNILNELAVNIIMAGTDYTNNKAKGLLHIYNTATCIFTNNTFTQTEFTEDLILLDGTNSNGLEITSTAINNKIIYCHTINISNGLIIKVCQLDNGYIENGYIAIYNHEPMRIASIIHVKTYCEYKEYIYAINSLEHLSSKELPMHLKTSISNLLNINPQLENDQLIGLLISDGDNRM